jgi:hypothetical protein
MSVMYNMIICLNYYCRYVVELETMSQFIYLFLNFILSFLHLLTCVYIVCATPAPCHFQAEPGLPSSPILLKRKHEQ